MSPQQKSVTTRRKNHDNALRWLLRDMVRRLNRIDARVDRLAARRVARS